MIDSRRQAADEVGIGIGSDAREDGDSKTGPNAGKKTRRCRMMDRDLVFEAKRFQPGLIMLPKLATAAADKGMVL